MKILQLLIQLPLEPGVVDIIIFVLLFMASGVVFNLSP
jgi:hypothetical protein